MEGTIDSGALETLMSVTGANEAVCTRLLQVTGGDLNAAVNTFFNDVDIMIPLPQGDDAERDDWMDEDEPAAGIPVQSAPTFPLPRPATNWGDADLASSRGGVQRHLPYGSGGLSHVVQRPEVRNIPIDWHDENENDEVRPPHPNASLSNPRIEELPQHDDIQQLPQSHHQAMVDEEVPSTASSAIRSDAEGTGVRAFGGLPSSDEELDPDFNPNAPRIAEVPVVAADEGIDIEEEMLRAAIEASRREADSAARRLATDFSQDSTGGGNLAVGFPARRAAEDDELARAVTLSLETAEAEKAQRERGGGSSDPIMMVEDEDKDSTFSEDARSLINLRRRGHPRDRSAMTGGAGASAHVGVVSSARERDRRSSGSRSSGSSTGAIVSSPPDESEEVEEQPLLRRRTSRRSFPSTAEPGIVGGESQTRSPFPRVPVDLTPDAAILPSASASASASAIGSGDDVGGVPRSPQQAEDPFADEWGGISSEEHDEAVMLEAALFGRLPDRTGLGLPYHTRHGIHNEMMDALMGGDGPSYLDAYNRRGIPQPPSPTVVAQRLIREQQDDEYLASLAADREKELKAIEEAESRRLKEQEAAEAAASEEKLRREEELKKQQEAEDLERQLALKKESLPLEPAADEQGALTLVVRLPDGSRRGRRFHKTNKLQSLFDFIDIGGGIKPGSYRLVRQYPRVAFTDAQHGSSLETVGLTSKQEVLFLEII